MAPPRRRLVSDGLYYRRDSTGLKTRTGTTRGFGRRHPRMPYPADPLGRLPRPEHPSRVVFPRSGVSDAIRDRSARPPLSCRRRSAHSFLTCKIVKDGIGKSYKKSALRKNINYSAIGKTNPCGRRRDDGTRPVSRGMDWPGRTAITAPQDAVRWSYPTVRVLGTSSHGTLDSTGLNSRAGRGRPDGGRTESVGRKSGSGPQLAKESGASVGTRVQRY